MGGIPDVGNSAKTPLSDVGYTGRSDSVYPTSDKKFAGQILLFLASPLYHFPFCFSSLNLQIAHGLLPFHLPLYSSRSLLHCHLLLLPLLFLLVLLVLLLYLLLLIRPRYLLLLLFLRSASTFFSFSYSSSFSSAITTSFPS